MKLLKVLILNFFLFTAIQAFSAHNSWSLSKSLFLKKRRASLKSLGANAVFLKKLEHKIIFTINFKRKYFSQNFFRSDYSFSDRSLMDDLERLVVLGLTKGTTFCNNIKMNEWGEGVKEASDSSSITVRFEYDLSHPKAVYLKSETRLECFVSLTN
jgi:hypothetical protein